MKRTTIKVGEILTRSGQFFKVISINSLHNERVVFLQNMESNEHLVKTFDYFETDKTWDVLDEDPVAKENRKMITSSINEYAEAVAQNSVNFLKIILGIGGVGASFYLWNQYQSSIKFHKLQRQKEFETSFKKKD